MSGMTFGSIVEADKRLIQHEQYMRTRKKALRDAEVWRMYEQDYERSQQQQANRQSKE